MKLGSTLGSTVELFLVENYFTVYRDWLFLRFTALFYELSSEKTLALSLPHGRKALLL